MYPVDNAGNMLLLRNFEETEDHKLYIEFRSTLNDLPFERREVYAVDEGKSIVICGDDGTVLYRIPTAFILIKLFDADLVQQKHR